MIQKMASPNHRIIVDPSILAQATARRQVTSEFSDDLVIQLHHRKALLLHPYPQMCSRTQVCLCGPHTVAFCMRSESTRLNSSHGYISYAVFCLKKKNTNR